MIDFGHIHCRNAGVRKRLIKNLFVSVRLCHHFDWQLRSVDVSAIAFVARDQKLPEKMVEICSLTIPMIIFMQKHKNKFPKKVKFLCKLH